MTFEYLEVPLFLEEKNVLSPEIRTIELSDVNVGRGEVGGETFFELKLN